jgi:hypothetical protein
MSGEESSRFTAPLIGVSGLSWVGTVHSVRRCAFWLTRSVAKLIDQKLGFAFSQQLRGFLTVAEWPQYPPLPSSEEWPCFRRVPFLELLVLVALQAMKLMFSNSCIHV